MATTRREFLGTAGAAMVGAAMLGAGGCAPGREPATVSGAAGGATAAAAGPPDIAYGGKVRPSPVLPQPDVPLPTDALAPPAGPKKRLTLLGTLWARHTHPDHVGTAFLEGYSIVGRTHRPHAELAGIYLDQVHKLDIGRAMAARYRVPVYESLHEALTGGTGRLAVDGVLLVCENGNYPRNDKGQKLYPRRQWFEDVVKVFRAAGRAVPVYHDKFFASTWADSAWIWRQHKELGIPLAAGSSVPMAWRRPALAFAPGIRLDGALAVGYAGLESYGFHTLELLQAFVEKRTGAAGVRSVEVLEGPAAWKAAAQGRWRLDLLRAALARTPLEADAMPRDLAAADPKALVILVEYADGFRAAAYLSRGLVRQFAFAAAVAGRRRPVATWAWLPKPQRDHFKFLCNHIEVLMRTGRAIIPPERTYLTTGMTLAAVDSHFLGRPVPTPHLAHLTYAPPENA